MFNFDKTLRMRSESQEDNKQRRLQVYPSWYYKKLIVAYSFMRQQSLGNTVEHANKIFFDSLPEEQRQELLKTYEEMTEHERKFPKKARPKRFDD